MLVFVGTRSVLAVPSRFRPVLSGVDKRLYFREIGVSLFRELRVN